VVMRWPSSRRSLAVAWVHLCCCLAHSYDTEISASLREHAA